MEISRCLMEWDADEPPPKAAELPSTVEGKMAPGHPEVPRTCIRAMTLVDTIPKVDRQGAERWVAKTGIDMTWCLAAWAGMALGNNASAGKQRYGCTRDGNQPLRTVFTQLAHTAARTKRTYRSALSHGIPTRRGRKEAIVVVAHAKVTSIFHMLMHQEPYPDLGANCFDEQSGHHLVGR
jgi:transposase